jgi:nitroreductase
MSDTAQDVFEIMRTTRPMRRLSPDPVPDELIERVLDAGTWAPNSLNAQPYRFLVMRDRESVAFFAERYDKAIKRGFAGLTLDPADNSPRARNIRVALSFGERMADVPVLLVICGVRDWPFAVPQDQRVGVPPPSYGSVYPCVQNMLLACRALGLGASLTTIHQLFEGELCARWAIPDDYGIVAVLPVGYPLGRFGPVGRRPSREITWHDRWGQSAPTAQG